MRGRPGVAGDGEHPERGDVDRASTPVRSTTISCSSARELLVERGAHLEGAATVEVAAAAPAWARRCRMSIVCPVPRATEPARSPAVASPREVLSSPTMTRVTPDRLPLVAEESRVRRAVAAPAPTGPATLGGHGQPHPHLHPHRRRRRDPARRHQRDDQDRLRLRAYADVDEANAHLGVALARRRPRRRRGRGADARAERPVRRGRRPLHPGGGRPGVPAAADRAGLRRPARGLVRPLQRGRCRRCARSSSTAAPRRRPPPRRPHRRTPGRAVGLGGAARSTPTP